MNRPVISQSDPLPVWSSPSIIVYWWCCRKYPVLTHLVNSFCYLSLPNKKGKNQFTDLFFNLGYEMLIQTKNENNYKIDHKLMNFLQFLSLSWDYFSQIITILPRVERSKYKFPLLNQNKESLFSGQSNSPALNTKLLNIQFARNPKHVTL